MGTVKDAAEALAKRTLDKGHNFKRIEAQATNRVCSVVANGSVLTANAFNIVSRYNDADESVVVYRGMVRIAQDTIQEVHRNLGLDLSSFAPTVWEVIPYSFVADYFTNIGDMIDAASFPRSTLSWVAKTIVLTKERKLDVECQWVWDTTVRDKIAQTWQKPSCVWRNSSVLRETYSGSLVPDFRFSIGEVAGSFQKQLNLTALARQNKGVIRLLNHLFVSK